MSVDFSLGRAILLGDGRSIFEKKRKRKRADAATLEAITFTKLNLPLELESLKRLKQATESRSDP